MRPFRFGVSASGAPSRAEWADKARRFEDLGFSTLLVPDHLRDIFPPLLPLITAAEATTSLRVGTFVLNNDFRHPVLLAREAAAVDLLTDGRLELGIGAGHMRSECDEAGIPFDPAPVRVERLAESVAILKDLLEGRPCTRQGRHYIVREHRAHPLPTQQPRPPILIGGNGRRLLALAAREADIVGLSGLAHRRGGAEVDVSGFKPAAVDERLAWIRAEAGDRFHELELNALVQALPVSGEAQEAAAAISRQYPVLSAEDALQTPFLLLGTPDQMVEALRARRERWGISYYVVFEPMAEALAPVLARLAGR